jgi:uncharacterized membrane protein
MNDVSTGKTENTEGMAKIVYVLYLASILVGVTSIIGVVIAYINKSEAPEWLRSHYQFQIRTFWIALLFSFIGALTTAILIGLVILLFTLVWFIIRCIKGLQSLDKKEAHPDPTTWMF